ncbi:MAG TPA: hypothetical protein PKD00_05800, partial [Burkholderiales bacterium]|nr:hypothetical protein [Burkholderiales bacterium]
VLKETPTIKVKHFLNAADAVDFINSQDNKRRICLLTDYELLNQKLNGLELINRTQIKRAILVTSYYDKLEIREKAAKFSIKILPKSLNFAVPIYFKDNKIIENKNVDMVWVDDAQEFIDGFIEKYYKHLSIDTYYDPNLFLDNFYHYPLNTKIVLDMFYYNDITFINDGLTIAKELHKVGYNNLYLTTAEMIPQDKIPDYLTVIQKNHFKHMSNLDKLQK